MKKVITLLMIFAVACLFACKPKNAVADPAPKLQKNTLQEQVLKVQAARLNAINQGDTLSIKAGLHPQFQFINAYGELLHTGAYLRQISAPKNANLLEKHYTKSNQSSFYNDDNAAIVSGIYITEKKSSQGVIVLTARFTDLYVKANQNWLLLASQHTRLSTMK
jgi:hypothetical protein